MLAWFNIDAAFAGVAVLVAAALMRLPFHDFGTVLGGALLAAPFVFFGAGFIVGIWARISTGTPRNRTNP